MGWLSNRLMRGASNRANERLTTDLGSYGPGTAILALALGHACYPDAIYGDKAIQDEIVQHLKQLKTRPCDAKRACQCVEAWLDKGLISTSQVFVHVWGIGPDHLLNEFFEESNFNK